MHPDSETTATPAGHTVIDVRYPWSLKVVYGRDGERSWSLASGSPLNGPHHRLARAVEVLRQMAQQLEDEILVSPDQEPYP